MPTLFTVYGRVSTTVDVLVDNWLASVIVVAM